MSKGPTKLMVTRSIIVMLIVIIVGFGITCGSLSYIILAKGDEYSSKAKDQQLRDTVTTAKRGNIYDKNMNKLATSATVWQVYVTPNSVSKNNKEAVATGLAKTMKIDEEKVRNIVNKTTGYENVGEPVDEDCAKKVRQFIVENNYGSVIGLDETTKRYYPNDNLASTVLGFVGKDNQGLYGVELQYDDELTGTKGRVVAAKNAKGSDLPFSYEKVVDAKQGNSIVLTVDEYIQHIVEKNLSENIEANSVANRGACIVMDVNSGEILAMATEPDFNPNEPFEISDKKSLKNEIKSYIKEHGSASKKIKQKIESQVMQEQWRNKAVSDAYEPGSVFKIITASSALEEGTLDDTQTFYCPGYIKIADRTIKCSNRDGHGQQSLAQAFMNSCNPAFISIGQNLKVPKFAKYRKSFGLQTKTGIDLPGESTSIYHEKNDMGIVELASESFGQTLKITPIQLITAVSAAVNGGYLYQPHILKQVLDSKGNVVKNVDSTFVRQVVSEKTSKQVCKYLEGVVSSGTGKNAYVAGYRIGGKTGTSEKIDTQTENSIRKKYICSFCGFAPADDPQIAILMMIDEPQVDAAYGGTLVAPSVGKMMEEILPYIGVTPSYTQDEASELSKSTPNVVNKTITSAKESLTSQGLNYRIIGKGETVVKQTPSATETIPAGGTVVLYTEKAEEKKKVTVPDFKGCSVSEANEIAVNSGLNMYINGNTSDSTAYAQSVEAGTKVDQGTVVTVSFREIVTVE